MVVKRLKIALPCKLLILLHKNKSRTFNPFQSAKVGLELVRAEPDRFDLVITDMTMPKMTGDKLARELLKIRPGIPVILCTGHSRLASEAKAKDIGIRALAMKPLVMRNLAETVRKVLDEK